MLLTDAMLSSVLTFRQHQYYDLHSNKYLDLAFITPNIIISSTPLDHKRQNYYPNKIEDLVEFLDNEYGRSNWTIFNLQSEPKLYSTAAISENIQSFPIVDHESPSLRTIINFVSNLDDWLSEPKHVALIHCKAGKGRSGTMACCYLLHNNMKSNPIQVNQLIARARFNDGSQSLVTILSQRRYVNYYYRYLHDQRIRYRIDHYYDTVKTSILEIVLHNATSEKIVVSVSKYDNDQLSNCTELKNPQPMSKRLIYRTNSSIESIDLRVSIELRIGTLPISFTHFWFNSLIECSSSPSHRKILHWEELDGFKGTYFRGLKLFDRVEIEYTLA